MGRSVSARSLRAVVVALTVVATSGVAWGVGLRPAGASTTDARPSALRPLSGCVTNFLDGNDDDSTDAVPLDFPLDLFGTAETELFVNNNGNVTFDAALGEYTPEDLTATFHPIFAPFFADVDTEGASTDPNVPNDSGLVIFYGSGANDGTAADHPVGQKYFCVNWRQVGYYSEHADKLNSFQLVIWDRGPSRAVPGADNFSLEFNYDSIQWETGDASDGMNGYGGTSAAVGWSDGSGNPGTNVQLDGSQVNGAFLDVDPATGLPGADALVDHSLNTTTAGRYLWNFDEGTAPVGGTITGRVFDTGNTDDATNGLSDAYVSVCPVDQSTGATTGRCHNTISGTNGAYSVASLPQSWYVATAYPTNGAPASSAATQVQWADGEEPPTVTGVDIGIVGPRPLPDGTHFDTTSGSYTDDGVTVPQFYWNDSYPFTTHLPAGCTLPLTDTPHFTVTGAHLDGSAYTATFPLTADPAVADTYDGTLPAFYNDDPHVAVHGPITITLVFPCGGGDSSQSFTAYIDPSGTVVDESSAPVTGATVTLLASDDAAGPFTPVPNGSAVMSVANRTNPQTTGADGAYGWDVIAGFYEVTAHKDGCTDATSPVLSIPPAVTGLTLTLACGGGGGGGGGGQPAPPTTTPTPSPTATPTTTPTATPTTTSTSTPPTLASGPTLRGSPHVGSTLTCAATYSDATWAGYGWTRDGKRLKGVTGRTYRLRPADFQHRIACLAAAYNSAGWSTAAASEAKAILAGPALRALRLPGIKGHAAAGHTLKVSTQRADWAPRAQRFSYQWLLDGKRIRHATSPTLRLTGDLVGKITVRVTAHAHGYANGVARSKATVVS